jgi:biotin synthase
MIALPDLTKTAFTRDEIVRLLATTDVHETERIRQAAEHLLVDQCGESVHFRGLIEASNICTNDCHYCGIRKSNKNVHRYQLDMDSVLELARACAKTGYGSLVIQTGERRDPRFVAFIEEALLLIKKETTSPTLPHGLGVTLSLGEQTEDTYRRWFNAGAHRYLLRIETTNPKLFAAIHPPEQRFEDRVACLEKLANAGYQVGTGVMIGLPGQTFQDLADDILFFRDHDIDMIGMGPFIPHPDTPMANATVPSPERRLSLALLMIAVTRLVLRDVNIAAATALQALNPLGRERGLRYGANVMMPLMTPEEVRADYLLYPGKPCLTESAAACQACLEIRLQTAGRHAAHDSWGDSVHALKKVARR